MSLNCEVRTKYSRCGAALAAIRGHPQAPAHHPPGYHRVTDGRIPYWGIPFGVWRYYQKSILEEINIAYHGDYAQALSANTLPSVWVIEGRYGIGVSVGAKKKED